MNMHVQPRPSPRPAPIAHSKASSEQESVSEYLSEDNFCMPINDLDKDSIAVEVMRQDHLSGSQYVPEGSVQAKTLE